MPSDSTESLAIDLEDGRTVSGLLQIPRQPLACLAIAHGAGAGMAHLFLSALAALLPSQRLVPRIPLFAGGKAFGGRMTSQAQSESPLPGVLGLIFLGFPLHPPGRPSDERGRHLFDVQVPMLFLQGTRGDFASRSLLRPLIERLGARATLELIADADHSFHGPARAGRSNEEVFTEMLDRLVAWMEIVRVDPIITPRYE